MQRGPSLGLDELMIVNPGGAGSSALFLGDDGRLYQVQGLRQADEFRGPGQFFLGEDGILYQALGYNRSDSTECGGISDEDSGEDRGPEPGRFLLGEDGTLYEVVRR